MPLCSFPGAEERIVGYVVPPLCGLRTYEMSSATATAIGDNTRPGRNRLPPPPRSPLNSTSHQVLSCCWMTVMMMWRWGWRYFADVDEVAAVSIDRARRRFKGVLGDILWNGSQKNIGNYRQVDGVRYTLSDIIVSRQCVVLHIVSDPGAGGGSGSLLTTF